MRFYTKRTDRKRMGEIVSERIRIIDGAGTLQEFAIDERDAEFVCAALNAADRQEALCKV